MKRTLIFIATMMALLMISTSTILAYSEDLQNHYSESGDVFIQDNSEPESLDGEFDPETISDLEAISDTEITSDPETISDTETISDPEAISDTETITGPETITDLEIILQPEIIFGKKTIPQTETISEPEARVFSSISAYAQSNPYITVTTGTAMGTQIPIFFDTTSGMPAYCLDVNRHNPDPQSLLPGLIPETVYTTPYVFEGLKALLLAGYPFQNGGLTNKQAQTCTQYAVWSWINETMGLGLNLGESSFTRGAAYDFYISLLETAHNQTLPDLGLSAEDISMTRDGDHFTGQTTVTFHNLKGGYTIDKNLLPDGMIVSGYTGKTGDVLTFTASSSFADQSFTIDNILLGHDERSPLNLFWYENQNPDQQRMVIPVMDKTAVAFYAGITFHFPSVGNIKLIKLAEGTSKPLADAVFGVYDSSTNKKVGEITTGENGEAILELPIGNYYLLELTAPDNYILKTENIPFSINKSATTVITVTNKAKTRKLTGFELIKTADNVSGLDATGRTFSFNLYKVDGWDLIASGKLIKSGTTGEAVTWESDGATWDWRNYLWEIGGQYRIIEVPSQNFTLTDVHGAIPYNADGYLQGVTFTIDEDVNEVSLTFDNTRKIISTISIEKTVVDKDGAVALEDWPDGSTFAFAIYDTNPVSGEKFIIDTVELDATHTKKMIGTLTTPMLIGKTYYIEEIASTPKNRYTFEYFTGNSVKKVNTGLYSFVATKDIVITARNSLLPASLKLSITKSLVDGAGFPLPAVKDEKFVFQITDGKRTFFHIITVPKGAASTSIMVSKLMPGNYTITELASNWRYTLISGNNVTKTLDNPDKVVSFAFTNKKTNDKFVSDTVSLTNQMPKIS